MSDGIKDPQMRNVHQHRHPIPPHEIPPRDGPLRDVRPDPITTLPQLIETPVTVSATRNAEAGKSPTDLPPLSLKQAGNLVGIFGDKKAAPSRRGDSPHSGGSAQGNSTSHPSLVNETIISHVKEIVEKRDESGLTDYLRGEVAQAFVDVVHQALNLSNLSPRLRRKYLSALYRICGRLALIPRLLQISVRYNRWSTPRYRGGYADVWKGEHEGHPVAAKVLRVYSTSDFEKISKRFCKEVMTWNALDHPNVLPLLGVMMDRQQFVMVSEWMENGNINESVKTHADANRFALLKDVARGLAYMHDQGMIHGDLKGANILIDQGGHARIADFGLLTVVSDLTNPTASSSFSMAGTIRWMSPELFYPDQSGLKDTRRTKQSDCYALGMVIYEVLSGQVPFTPFHYCIVIRKVIDGERPARPNGQEGERFTDDLWRTLDRCWATEPQQRPSVGVVLECLECVSRDLEMVSQQVDETLGDGDDLGVASDSQGEPSWFNPHYFAFLCDVLCLSQLQAITKKILASRGGGTDLGRSQPAAPAQDPS